MIVSRACAALNCLPALVRFDRAVFSSLAFISAGSPVVIGSAGAHCASEYESVAVRCLAVISIVCKHPRIASVLACKASPAIISVRCVSPVFVVCVVSVFISGFSVSGCVCVFLLVLRLRLVRL